MSKKKFSIFIFLLAGISIICPDSQLLSDSNPSELERIKLEIELQGLRWEAGETSISKLSSEHFSLLMCVLNCVTKNANKQGNPPN